jgi:hypothetical protein
MEKEGLDVFGRKKRLLIPVAVFVGTLFLLFYSFPKAIELDHPAVEYRNDGSAQAELTRIRIKGILTRPLFRDGSFRGSIVIDKYDFTRTYKLAKVQLAQRDNTTTGLLIYFPVSTLLPVQSLGMLRMSGDFERLIIYRPHVENGQVPYILTAPARTLEEALANQSLLEEEL